MKKSLAIFFTVIIAIISLFLSIFYWKFSAESIDAETWFMFLSSFISLVLIIGSFVSFYKTARNKNNVRTAFNFVLSILIVSVFFSLGMHLLNEAIFNSLHSGRGFINQSAINSPIICGQARDVNGDLLKISTNFHTKKNDLTYSTVLCPSIIYKTDQIIIDKGLVDAINENRKKEASHE